MGLFKKVNFLFLMLVAGTAFAADTKINTDRILFGTKTTNNKDLLFNLNAGSLNPLIRADGGSSTLKYSLNGSTFKTFNLGSDINSGSALAGQVLTANGSGASSYITPAQTLPRNFAQNPNFYWCQRCNIASSLSIANATSFYLMDRWYGINSMGGSSSLTYAVTSPTQPLSLSSIDLTVATAPTSAQNNLGIQLWQTLDANDSNLLFTQTASFSAVVKAFGNVNQIGIQFMSNATENIGGTSISTESLCTVNSSTDTTCTLNGINLGGPFTPGTGVFAVRIRATNVSTGNVYDVGNGFKTQLPEWNIGMTAAAWHKDISSASELLQMQMFYQLLTAEGVNKVLGQGAMTSTTASQNLMYYTKKRTTPTLTFSASTDFNAHDIGTAGNFQCSSISGSVLTTESALFTCNTAGVMVQFHPSTFQFAGTSGYVEVDAEIH